MESQCTNLAPNSNTPKLDGRQVAGSVTHIMVSDIRPGATAVEKMYVLPRRAGPTTLVATFSSAELNDVKGSTKVEVIKQH